MGRQIVRKRRVFSLEPNKLAYTIFARNYVKYLMTSLLKISSNNPSHHQQPQNFQRLVKFEVDMAMAQSASEFAWGSALKKKLLQRKVGNGHGNCFDFSLQTVKFSQENLEREEEEKEEQEEEKMENGLMKLRKIIPGGGDFNGGLEEEDLLKQTESYIKCLELQVNVLRCLVETNTI